MGRPSVGPLEHGSSEQILFDLFDFWAWGTSLLAHGTYL